MLKNIPKIIPPDLLKILCEMGHGDEIVIADGNFPASSVGKRVVTMSGNGTTEILDAILKLFPLDTYEKPIYLMSVVPGDNAKTPIWEDYRRIVSKYTDSGFEYLKRFDFYARARNAYAVISTGESALYANILLKKGVVAD